jgi:hypothetical protein
LSDFEIRIICGDAIALLAEFETVAADKACRLPMLDEVMGTFLV